MFLKSQFQTLFAYHWHTTNRLLERASQLPKTDYYHQPGYGHGSIHDLFFHLLRTDYGWRVALESGRQSPPLPAENYPDLATIQSAFASEQQAWEVYWQQLEAPQIEQEISLLTLRGQAFAIPRWRILQHLALHGMQHHSELGQLLTAKGQSPGDIDFIFFS